MVCMQDPLMPELLQLVPEADLHDDPAVSDGRLVLQVQPSWAIKHASVSDCALLSYSPNIRTFPKYAMHHAQTTAAAEQSILLTSCSAETTAGMAPDRCLRSTWQQDQPRSRCAL